MQLEVNKLNPREVRMLNESRRSYKYAHSPLFFSLSLSFSTPSISSLLFPYNFSKHIRYLSIDCALSMPIYSEEQ